MTAATRNALTEAERLENQITALAQQKLRHQQIVDEHNEAIARTEKEMDRLKAEIQNAQKFRNLSGKIADITEGRFKLTKKNVEQAEVLHFIFESQLEGFIRSSNDIYDTMKEYKTDLNFSTVRSHIHRLKENGYIRKTPQGWALSDELIRALHQRKELRQS